MDGQFFTFQNKSCRQEPKIPTVKLSCDDCGDTDVRPLFIAITGHLHDQKCTYICKNCRGVMREVNADT
jgi:hypothetical protein